MTEKPGIKRLNTLNDSERLTNKDIAEKLLRKFKRIEKNKNLIPIRIDDKTIVYTTPNRAEMLRDEFLSKK